MIDAYEKGNSRCSLGSHEVHLSGNCILLDKLPMTIIRLGAVFGPGSYSFGTVEARVLHKRSTHFLFSFASSSPHSSLVLVLLSFADICRLISGRGVLVGGGYFASGVIFVDDAVEELLQAAFSPNTIGKIYNGAANFDVTWRQ